LIKVGNGADPEVFSTVGGLRTSRMVLNNKALDTTNLESGPWKQLLGSAGISSMVIEGGGLFTDSASEETLRLYAFANSANNYRFVFANGDNVTGPFMVTAYERDGNYNDAETFAITLESAGTLTFAS
jgi:TP901-1 family phage major tail protein